MEEIHGDWQHISAEDETALAVNGEGAAALEGVRRVVIPPISEAERDELRAKMSKRHPNTRGLEYGPNGQMISIGRKAVGRRRYED